MFFDTHTHLNDEKLYKDIEKIIRRSKKANVNKILVAGYDVLSSELAVKIANKYDFIYAAVGIHPGNIKDIKKEDILAIEKLIVENKKVVAVGEVGLDYYWTKDNKDKQKEVFIEFIKMAKKYDKPIIVHSRDAYIDTYNTIKNYKEKNAKGVMHCYSYSKENVEDFVSLGMMISYGGAVTFLNNKIGKEAIKVTPLESLLIETDCPYLTPHPHRGKVNEPMYLPLVAEEIAKLKNITTKEIADITYKNACIFFKIEGRN